ncbi:hypothetical protein [Bradyrhizobium sp. STM 3557]|uniref:hypothetical protein n=1 Tax=Bradyrhizobium sp. STM 3557 TaxID=578920 RepID=UPI00388F93B7
MMGRPDPTLQRLVLAMLVVHAVSLAALGPSHAAAANSSSSDLVNGMPCNDPCKAYMAWSDRMLARFALPRPQASGQTRTAAHPKKPERTARHVTGTRRPSLNSLAQFSRQSGEAPQSGDPRQVEMASSQPTSPISAGLFSADTGITEQRSEAGGARAALADPTPMSVASPVPAAQQPATAEHAAASRATRLQISLALAFCALLAFGSWGWIRVRTEAANAIQ